MKNRVWSGILCAALLLVGCGGERTETKENDVVRDTQSEADTMETDTELLSVLPAVDWEGYEFRILTTDVRVNETMYHEVYSEGVNGEVVNDAVYARNMSVEDKYKIKITGVFSGLRDFSLFEKAAQAGDDAFDVVLPDQQNAMRYAGRGYLTELSTVPYLDFDRAYWLKNSVTELSIGGRSYFFVGDMNLSAYESVPVYFFFLNPVLVPVQFSPFSKCRLYSAPSRRTVTSIYSEEYCVAQVPRPFNPSENS